LRSDRFVDRKPLPISKVASTSLPSSSDPPKHRPPPNAQTSNTSSLFAFKDVMLKRFSALPRPPSSSGSSSKRLSSPASSKKARTSSPASVSLPPTPPPRDLPPLPSRRPPMQKVKCFNPPALLASEILSRQSSMERSMLYAEKINELYMQDCGLADW